PGERMALAVGRFITAASSGPLARCPRAAEREACTTWLRRQAELFRTAKRPSSNREGEAPAEPGLSTAHGSAGASPSPPCAADARRNALVQLCHTLLNTSEFLYAE